MILELRDGGKLGLTAEIAEKLVVVVLSVLLLRLEVDVQAFLMLSVLGQLLFARVEMRAPLALEFVLRQRVVELQLLWLRFVLLHTAQHEFFVRILKKKLTSLIADERNLLRHNVFNY